MTLLIRLLLAWLAYASLGLSQAAVPDAQAAASLHAQYAALAEKLQNNAFKKNLHLDSSESSKSLKGDIYALVDYPFSSVSQALNNPDNWCDVLILHINTKYCQAATDKTGTVLTVNIGKKTAQPLEDAYPIEFNYRVAALTTKYLDIQLKAEKGPMSTRQYRIQLQAVPVSNGRTFLHMSYSYAYGLSGRLAMQAYLATIGSDKVGFTLTGGQSNAQPEYIGGMRGLVERNTMRYYLAIDAFLGAMAAPPASQLQKRLQSWFTATEQYPRQLREMDRTAYIDMKQGEYLRQQKTR